MGTIASAQREILNKDQPRKRPPLNRAFHRVGGFLASLLMLWMAGTGITMQVIDLKAILTHEPATNPTVLSMNEGRYGPNNFAVIQLSDIDAPALPPGLDINQAIARS